MRYEEGLVSVIIPTYKRLDTVMRAVKSVLDQTYESIECIVVNDNDPDDDYSMDLKKQFQRYTDDKRVRFLHQPVHKNGAAARNYGIEQAKGEFIAFLDDDDWWKKEKIEKQIKFLKCQDKNCAAVSTLAQFYKNGKIVRKTIPYSTEKILLKILGREIEVLTPSVLIRRECLDKCGYFDERLRRHQEVQLLSFLTSKYTLSLLPEYLTCIGYEDCQNKPAIKEFISIKKEFFRSVKPLVMDLSDSDRRCIIELHRLEVAYRKWSDGFRKAALKDILKITRSPKAAVRSVKRVLNRLKEERL